MAVRIEIIDQFIVKDYGGWKHGKSIAFPNYNSRGERELLVFDEKKNSTIVYLANPDIDEVDIAEQGIDAANFKKLKTLKEGGDPLIIETSSRDGERTKVLRLSHVKKSSLKPKLRRPLIN